VRAIDFRTVGTGGRGKVTKEVQDAFFQTVSGHGDRSGEWLNFVEG
jgi:hypothetical protein